MAGFEVTLHGRFWVTPEAHINTIDVQHSSFKIGLPSYTLNEQQFDAEIVGDVNATNLSAKLILSSDNGTTLSFPFTSVRKEVKH